MVTANKKGASTVTLEFTENSLSLILSSLETREHQVRKLIREFHGTELIPFYCQELRDIESLYQDLKQKLDIVNNLEKKSCQ